MRLRKNPAGNDFSIGKKFEWDLQMPTDITTCENGCRIFSLHGKDFFTCQIVVEYQKDVVNRRRLNLNADEYSSIAENVIRLFCMHSAANVCLHHCQWLAKRVNNGAHNKVKSCVAVTGKMPERPSNDASSEHCDSMFLWLLVILHARAPSHADTLCTCCVRYASVGCSAQHIWNFSSADSANGAACSYASPTCIHSMLCESILKYLKDSSELFAS